MRKAPNLDRFSWPMPWERKLRDPLLIWSIVARHHKCDTVVHDFEFPCPPYLMEEVGR